MLCWNHRPVPSHLASVETFQVRVTMSYAGRSSSVGVSKGFVYKVAGTPVTDNPVLQRLAYQLTCPRDLSPVSRGTELCVGFRRVF